ncbi:glycosyltransferase family 2 protein [Litoribacillus peritrichatus]|uniref:Glycosyltransferase family 2 protein n=1 Tax=Litoribacillus peritrichatus TaxID=718191 RepID=A0ABP7M5R4_9GAMM
MTSNIKTLEGIKLSEEAAAQRVSEATNQAPVAQEEEVPSVDAASASVSAVTISVVTTALNEAGNVQAFLNESVEALQGLAVSWEIIYIDDGSVDETPDLVLAYIEETGCSQIRLIRHGHSQGITAALEESIKESNGEFVCLLPADMESSPKSDIPALYNALDDNTDVVLGRRIGRDDGKSFASAVYNNLNRVLFNVDFHDANWIKIFRREKANGVHLRSEWHRFFVPILASRGCRIKEVDVVWHSRQFGKSKFGLSRFPVSLADMLAVKLIITYSTHPLLLFSWISFISFIVSLVSLMIGLSAPEGADRQWFGGVLIAAGLMVISFISLCIGACAEMLLGMKGVRDDQL